MVPAHSDPHAAQARTRACDVRTDLQFRPCLAVLAVAAMSVTHRGGFSSIATAGAVVALAVAIIACLRADQCYRVPALWSRVALLVAAGIMAAESGYWYWLGESWRPLVVGIGSVLVAWGALTPRFSPPSMTAAIIGGSGLVLGAFGVFRTWLALPERTAFCIVVRLGTAAGMGLMICCALRPPSLGRRGLRGLAIAVFAVAAMMRHATVLASPDPIIDVYGWLRQAPANLLAGKNPYAARYANVYGSDRARKYGAFISESDPHPAAYPPLPILLALPFTTVGLDVRLANVWCDLVAAYVLFLAGRRRGNSHAGLLLAAAYLNLPGAPYLIENAWYEPMLAATLGVGLLLAERGGKLGMFLLAFGLTGKQFGLAMLMPLLKGLRGRRGILFCATAVVVLMTMFPFWLWDSHSFMSVVVWKQLDRAVDVQANTLFGAMHHWFAWSVSRYAALLIAAGLILLVSWATPPTGVGAALWMGTSLLALLFCNSVAFFNYFYLVEYLLFLGAAGLILPDAASAALAAGRSSSLGVLEESGKNAAA
jgi:hypothetical protein